MSREREGEDEPRPAEDGAGAPPRADEATSDEEPVRSGDRVGPYEILELLGRGGMGVVYRARDARLERDVALKSPLLRLSGDAEVRRRFLREARAAAALSHPHIVPVYETLEWGGRPWVVMELVEGASLSQRLRDRTPLPLRELLRVGEGVASALAAAHARGILHRDVNPNNILVRPDGWPLLTDFGLAHLLEGGGAAQAETTGPTSRGVLVGTRYYLSPEQILGRTLDGRSDLFSLGAVLYEMATGHRAFATPLSGQELDAILHRTPPPIGSTPGAPVEIEPIVRRAMAKDPADRYPDAPALAADLAALRRRLSFEDQLAHTPAPPPEATSSASAAARSPSRRAALLAAGATLAVVVGLVLWSRARPLDDPDPPISAIAGTPRQITSDPGWEADPALSPDGNLIVYTSNASGNPDIWLVDAAGGGRLRLTDDPMPDENPVWFPDGGAIAFASRREGRSSIWRVPKLGGSPTLLVPDASAPAISPDGRRIAFLRADSSGNDRIAVAPLDETEAFVWWSPDETPAWQLRDLAWSPDSATLAYSDGRDLWLSGSGGTAPRRLTRERAADLDPAWTRDGRFLLLSSFRESTCALWKIPVSGGRPQRLTVGSGPESQPSVSRDGRRLAYSTFAHAFDLAIVDRKSDARRTIASELDESSPTLAADGSAVAYVSGQAGAGSAIWLQPLAAGAPAGEPRRLTVLSGSMSTPALSPDGGWVAFKREAGGEREIWIVSARGGLAERFSEPGVDSLHPAWSPDGTRLAYSARIDREYRILVAPVREGRRAGASSRVGSSPASDFSPAWSPDGRTVAFVRSEKDLWLAPAPPAVEPAPRRVGTVDVAGRLRWDRRSGDLLAGSVAADGRVGVMRFGVAPEQPSTQADWEPFVDAAPPGDFDLTADGNLLVYTTQRTRGDIWLLEARRALF